MFAWYFRLPLLVRVPLLSAVLIFLIAMAVMQISIFSLTSQYERQTERVGQVYLDGLSAAVAVAYRERDIPAIDRALERSLSVYLGVVDRQLAVIDRQDGVLAHRAGPNLGQTSAPPPQVYELPKGYAYDAASRSLWVWRELDGSGIVAANLDISDFARERSALRWRLVLVGLALSLLAALGGYLVIRRIQHPLGVLSVQLHRAAAFGAEKIPEAEISGQDGQAQTLMHAYNELVQAVQDRELITERLARQDRQALLGRIAATLAHEIRNPLTGIMTALQTVRMYGDDAASRNEALDFVDRGIQSLQGVAQATLDIYRPSARGPALTLRDLEDVALLVEPHARRRDVALQTSLRLPAAVGLDAFKMRQIALNLLLNAIQTSPPQGTVRYEASCAQGVFCLSVSDQGPGLPGPMREFLLAGQAEPAEASLGIATIRRLAMEMRGRIAVQDRPGAGAEIRLTFEIPEEDVKP
ncbi:ATP-binding protein [Orrella sp. JC864]|uniref:ATP-binding protein n=1 Tax=Orrella sp. JC864 TaxID=3120298 RepID=UPI0012BCC66E